MCRTRKRRPLKPMKGKKNEDNLIRPRSSRVKSSIGEMPQSTIDDLPQSGESLRTIKLPSSVHPAPLQPGEESKYFKWLKDKKSVNKALQKLQQFNDQLKKASMKATKSTKSPSKMSSKKASTVGMDVQEKGTSAQSQIESGVHSQAAVSVLSVQSAVASTITSNLASALSVPQVKYKQPSHGKVNSSWPNIEGPIDRLPSQIPSAYYPSLMTDKADLGAYKFGASATTVPVERRISGKSARILSATLQKSQGTGAMFLVTTNKTTVAGSSSLKDCDSFGSNGKSIEKLDKLGPEKIAGGMRKCDKEEKPRTKQDKQYSGKY